MDVLCHLTMTMANNLIITSFLACAGLPSFDEVCSPFLEYYINQRDAASCDSGSGEQEVSVYPKHKLATPQSPADEFRASPVFLILDVIIPTLFLGGLTMFRGGELTAKFCRLPHTMLSAQSCCR